MVQKFNAPRDSLRHHVRASALAVGIALVTVFSCRPLAGLRFSVSPVALQQLSPCWVIAGSRPREQVFQMSVLPRHFFQNTVLDPRYWSEENFVQDHLVKMLPKFKPKAKMVVVDMEPEGSRYWYLLKPDDKPWYLDKINALGEGITFLGKAELDGMAQTAKNLGSACQFFKFNPKTRSGLVKECADVVLLSDNSIKRLGANKIDAALGEIRRILKRTGHCLFIATADDEKVLGRLDLGFESPLLRKHGLEIMGSVRGECGLNVGFLKKKLPTAASKQRPAAATRRPAARQRRSDSR